MSDFHDGEKERNKRSCWDFHDEKKKETKDRVGIFTTRKITKQKIKSTKIVGHSVSYRRTKLRLQVRPNSFCTMSTKDNNSGSNGNQRKPLNKKFDNPTSGMSKSTSTRPKLVRELKFNLHDSVQRKSSESFGKIKEAIITKIYLEFDNPIEIAESLKVGTKNVFKKPDIKKLLVVMWILRIKKT